MKQIYNEGRVVGYSAYELYLRQQLADDPNADVPSEREWLASTVGNGSSMILKIPSNTAAGYHDYVLPSGSTLCSASYITASVFTGSCKCDSNGWATKVTSYGELINNTSSSSPSTPGTTVPTSVTSSYTPGYKKICTEYAKIVEGLAYQPGTWSEYGQDGVAKEFEPDLSKSGVIRLRLSAATLSDTYVIFHGFLYKSVISGVSGFDHGMDTDHPENGDFLGPVAYPWAVQIHFMQSNEISTIIDKLAFTRKLPTNGSAVSVSDKAIIDFNTHDPSTFYTSTYSGSVISENVTDLNVDSANVITLYQRNSSYPGALYGSKISSTGTKSLYPLDTSAPGTIKFFTNESLASSYPTAYKNVYSLYMDSNHIIYIFDDQGNKTKVGSDVSVAVTNTTVDTNKTTYVASVTADNSTIKTISLTDAVNGNLLNMTGSSAEISVDSLNWATLLDALKNNKRIKLASISEKLQKFETLNLQHILTDNKLNDLNVDKATVSGGLTVTGGTSTDSATVSNNYITLDGIRLYIANSAPSGAPVGSIGIGW